MSDKITISIVGTNGVSQVFTAVARDAETMGTTVQRASQNAGKATTQMGTDAEAAAERSSASYEKIGNAIGKVGLAFGAFTLLATKASGDSEASAARLSTAFQNAGLAVEDYKGQIDQLNSTGLHLGFDDEDVQDALAGLLTVTGDVQQSIKDVGLAEDIARAKGVSLASATQTVIAAENGRFRGLAALGVAIDSTSSKESVLADAQAKFAGQAAAYATTGAASFDRVKNSAENALESVGAKLEGLQVPILALSSAGAALGPLTSAFRGLSDVGGIGAALGQTGALAASLGPIGLAGAAIAAGAGIVYLATKVQDYDDVAKAASASTQNLTNFFKSLAASLDPIRAEKITGLLDATNQLIDDAATRQSDLNHLLSLQTDMQGQQQQSLDLSNETVVKSTEAYFGLTEAQLHYLDTNHDTKLSIDEVSAAIATYQGNLDRLDAGQLKSVQTDLMSLFSHSEINVDKATSVIEGWEEQLQHGSMSAEVFVSNIHNAATSYSDFIDPVKTATTVLAENTAAVSANGNAIANQMAVYNAQNQSLDQAIQFNQANTKATDDDTAARKANASAIEAQMAAYSGQNASLGESPYQSKKSADIGQIDESGNARASLSNLTDLFNEMNPAAETASHAVDGLSAALEDQAKASADADQAMRDQLGGYYDVVNGIYTADSALAAFKATQDGLIQSEGVYGQQLSEYSSQVNEITAAHELLNQRVADGIPLTAQQQEFQDSYNEALERGNGAVDDATIAQGMLAEQYLLNMKQGDELNRSMQDQTGAVGDLVGVVKELIDTLLGVPPEVKSQVDLEGADAATSQLAFMQSQLDALDGRTVVSTVEVRSSGSIFFPGTGAVNSTGRNGGVMGYAGGGVVARMGEAGAEMLHFPSGGPGMAKMDGMYSVPRGTYVDTAPVTKMKANRAGGMVIHNPVINVFANDPQQFTNALSEWAIGNAR